MEFLLQIITALLLLPLIGGIAWATEIVGLLLLGLFARKEAVRARWRKTVWGFSAVLCLGLLGLLCVDLFFFESCVRFAVGRLEQRSDITLEFREAKGSLFFGRVELDGAHIKIGDRMDLTLDEAEINISVLGLFRHELPIELVRAKGVRGTLSYAKGTHKEASRPFRIERVELTDLDLRIEEPKFQVLHIPLRIDSLVFSPLRSEDLAWNVLCDTTATMHAYGLTLTANRGWSIEALPFHMLEGLPLKALKLGNLPVQANVTLTCPTADTVELGFRLKAKGWLDRLTPDVHVATTLHRDQFQGATRISQLWDEVLQSWHMEVRK